MKLCLLILFPSFSSSDFVDDGDDDDDDDGDELYPLSSLTPFFQRNSPVTTNK